MCRFKLWVRSEKSPTLNLNTSHVSVQDFLGYRITESYKYLNTSHVSVQALWRTRTELTERNLNTSHVSVQVRTDKECEFI